MGSQCYLPPGRGDSPDFTLAFTSSHLPSHGGWKAESKVPLMRCKMCYYSISNLGIQTRNPKVIWEKPRRHPSRRRITMPQQSPHWLQWDAPHNSKTASSLRRSPPKSNTPIPSPTPLTTPNGIRIQSAVLPQLTVADRQMGQTNVLYH